MPILADDDVVMNSDTKRTGGFHDRLRHVDVSPRRSRVAGRVIMDHAIHYAKTLINKQIM